jgi:methylmalonyl-CoA carboxyltransferase large subunit
MNVDTQDWTRVVDALETIRRDLDRLSARVAALEAPLAATPAPAATPPEELTADLVIVISAAIAAFLGVRPHIRQIRLLRSAGWAQQGRITIQASHALARSER